MKAIDYAKGLKKKLSNNLAPITKGEINLLVDMLEKEQAQKPTVVVCIDGGLITDILASTEMTAVVTDFDIEGSSEAAKETPFGEEAIIKFDTVHVPTDTSDIDKWVALANQ